MYTCVCIYYMSFRRNSIFHIYEFQINHLPGNESRILLPGKFRARFDWNNFVRLKFDIERDE